MMNKTIIHLLSELDAIYLWRYNADTPKLRNDAVVYYNGMLNAVSILLQPDYLTIKRDKDGNHSMQYKHSEY